MHGAIADDCMDAGGRAMQEQLPRIHPCSLGGGVPAAYPKILGLSLRARKLKLSVIENCLLGQLITNQLKTKNHKTP